MGGGGVVHVYGASVNSCVFVCLCACVHSGGGMGYIVSVCAIHLFIPVEDLPKVMDVQLRLHVLLTIVGDIGDLKEVIPHQVQCLLDLGDRGLLWLVAMGTSTPRGPPLVHLLVRLESERVGTVKIS